MERRTFLKDTCQVCLLGAAGFILPQIGSCSSAKYSVYKAAINNKTIEVPLTQFATSALQIVRPNGWYRDIAVQKKDDGTYSALLLECTHQENALTVTGNGYHCNLHGSEFDRNGNVRKGPAETPLTHYETTIQPTALIIHV